MLTLLYTKNSLLSSEQSECSVNFQTLSEYLDIFMSLHTRLPFFTKKSGEISPAAYCSVKVSMAICIPSLKAYSNIATSPRLVYSSQQSWNFSKISICSSVKLFSQRKKSYLNYSLFTSKATSLFIQNPLGGNEK